MSIVTKTGDSGKTGLFGGKRVPKDDARIHAYGTVDELNSILGLIVAAKHADDVLTTQITNIQHRLFRLGADLATPLSGPIAGKRMREEDTAELEQWIAAMEQALPEQKTFILPGGSPVASLLHVARTVCRRAERWTATLAAQEEINPQGLIYLNRLSDCLFLLARTANLAAGTEELKVQYE